MQTLQQSSAARNNAAALLLEAYINPAAARAACRQLVGLQPTRLAALHCGLFRLHRCLCLIDHDLVNVGEQSRRLAIRGMLCLSKCAPRMTCHSPLSWQRALEKENTLALDGV
jgi:hypothetical protein